MARRRTNQKRNDSNGSVYLYRGKYVLQYSDPITGKRRIKSLVQIIDGLKKPVTIRADAETVAAEFLKDITQISDIQHKEEVILKVAEQKRLIRSLTLKIDEVWQKFQQSPSRRDAGESTLKGYSSIWELFRKFLRHQMPPLQNLAEIDAAVTEAYFTQLWQQGVSEQTYNNHLQVLSLVFRTLLGADFHTENPFRSIQKKTRNTQKRDALTVEQLQKIFALLADDHPYHLLHKSEMRLLIKLMTFTGCRGEDAALMEWKNIHLSETGRATITYTPEKTRRKNPHPVCVPIHSDLLRELQEARLRRDPREPLVLPQVHERYQRNPSGISKDVMKLMEAAGIATQEIPSSHIRRQTYSKPLLDADGKPVLDRRGRPKTISQKKKICRVSMHSFRHTFVSLAANAGIPLEVVRAIVGHASDDMTRHYLHVSDARKDSAVDALPMLSEIPDAEITSFDRPEALRELMQLAEALPDDALSQLVGSLRSQ